MLLQLRCELEDFLVLLVLCLIVDCELTLCIVDVLFDEPALVLGPSDVVFDPLHLQVFLAELLASVHDVTVRRVHVLSQVRVLPLEILELGLENLLIPRLLLNLLLVVLAQMPHAIFKQVLALLDLLDAELESFVK